MKTLYICNLVFISISWFYL